MGSKGTGVKKKTRNEVKAYRDFVKNGVHNLQDTVAINNENLRGSAELCSSSHLSAEAPSVKWHYKIRRFLKNHTFETILVTLLCAFIAWGSSMIITLKVDLAVVQTRVDYLDEQIDGLTTDSATKEIIELQLESIRKDLSSAFDFKISEIKTQLDLIEQQIKYIEKNSAGN